MASAVPYPLSVAATAATCKPKEPKRSNKRNNSLEKDPNPNAVKHFSKTNRVTGVQVTLIFSYFPSSQSTSVSRALPQTLLGGGGGSKT